MVRSCNGYWHLDRWTWRVNGGAQWRQLPFLKRDIDSWHRLMYTRFVADRLFETRVKRSNLSIRPIHRIHLEKENIRDMMRFQDLCSYRRVFFFFISCSISCSKKNLAIFHENIRRIGFPFLSIDKKDRQTFRSIISNDLRFVYLIFEYWSNLYSPLEVSSSSSSSS